MTLSFNCAEADLSELSRPNTALSMMNCPDCSEKLIHKINNSCAVEPKFEELEKMICGTK